MWTWPTLGLLPVSVDAHPRHVGAADYAAEIDARELRILVGEHVSLYVAEGSLRLIPDAVVEGLDDVFLEAVTRGCACTTASRSASENSE
jgi:hypothetical protein